MKFIAMILLLGLTSVPVLASKKKSEPLILTEKNTVQLYGSVNKASVDLALEEFQTVLKYRPKTVYLVLNSEGGELREGFRLTEALLGLPIQVKTITKYAASMAFHMVQALDERLILPTGVIMGHRVRVAFEAEIPEDSISIIEHHLMLANFFDGVIAKRMRISLEEYRRISKPAYRAVGKKAVEDKAADRVIVAKCDKSLSGSREVKLVNNEGGLETHQRPNCPL